MPVASAFEVSHRNSCIFVLSPHMSSFVDDAVGSKYVSNGFSIKSLLDDDDR